MRRKATKSTNWINKNLIVKKLKSTIYCTWIITIKSLFEMLKWLPGLIIWHQWLFGIITSTTTTPIPSTVNLVITLSRWQSITGLDNRGLMYKTLKYQYINFNLQLIQFQVIQSTQSLNLIRSRMIVRHWPLNSFSSRQVFEIVIWYFNDVTHASQAAETDHQHLHKVHKSLFREIVVFLNNLFVSHLNMSKPMPIADSPKKQHSKPPM